MKRSGFFYFDKNGDVICKLRASGRVMRIKSWDSKYNNFREKWQIADDNSDYFSPPNIPENSFFKVFYPNGQKTLARLVHPHYRKTDGLELNDKLYTNPKSKKNYKVTGKCSWIYIDAWSRELAKFDTARIRIIMELIMIYLDDFGKFSNFIHNLAFNTVEDIIKDNNILLQNVEDYLIKNYII